MVNDQKPRSSSCIVIEPHNFKFLSFLLHCYHIPHLKNFAILILAIFTSQFKNFTNHSHEIFLVGCSPWFFFEDRNYVSIIITIISNITVSVYHNIICLRYFMPMTHVVNEKALLIVSISPPTFSSYKTFTRFVCCFTRNTLSNFFCSDQVQKN